MNKLIYPELSYQIIGVAYTIFNELGYGRSEKFYQRAFEQLLETSGINFTRELMVRHTLQGKPFARYYLDFVIEGKVVVELKVRPRLGYVHIKQVVDYLNSGGYKLAIILYFTPDGVKFRRVLNAN